MKVKIVRILFLAIIFIAFTKLYSMAAIHSTDPTASTDSTVSITIVSTEEVDNYNVSIKDSGGLSFQGISSNPGAIINGSMVGYMSLTDKVSTLATYTFKTPSTPGRYIVKFDINGTANNSIVTVTGKENESNQAQNNDNNQSNEEASNQENTQQQSNEQEQAQSQETPEPQEPVQQTEEPQTPAETKKSSNANLSNLGIREHDFKGFRSWQTEYKATVPNEAEKITVYATLAKDSRNAKIVSGTGSQNLNVGNNEIKVVVKAEDGTEKVYTINVTREEKKEEEAQPANEVAEETTTENEEENQKKSDLVKLEIEGQKLTPSFSADVYEYKLNVSKDIEALNVITEGANENINIEVAGNKEIKEGENLITILVYNNETKQNSTYQIIVNKASAEPIGTEDVNPILNSTIKKAKRNRYIVIGIGVFILVGIIVFIIVKNRNQDEDDEEYDEEYDEDQNTDEANHDEIIDLSEDEGLFRRVNREDFKLESKTSPKSIDNEYQEKITSKANFEKNPNDLEDRDIRKKGKHF